MLVMKYSIHKNNIEINTNSLYSKCYLFFKFVHSNEMQRTLDTIFTHSSVYNLIPTFQWIYYSRIGELGTCTRNVFRRAIERFHPTNNFHVGSVEYKVIKIIIITRSVTFGCIVTIFSLLEIELYAGVSARDTLMYIEYLFKHIYYIHMKHILLLLYFITSNFIDTPM